jgi:aspartate aminotransferase-like enzyme
MLVIDPGYGRLRGQTFRLSNMGDENRRNRFTFARLFGRLCLTVPKSGTLSHEADESSKLKPWIIG